MKYIGKRIEYHVKNGEQRVATIKQIEFHPGLKKPLFIAISPFGNMVRLTREEFSISQIKRNI